MEVTQVIRATEAVPSCSRPGTCAGLVIGLAFAIATWGCTGRIRPPTHSSTGVSQTTTAALAEAGSGGELPIGKEPERSQLGSTPESHAAPAVIESQSGGVSAVEARDCSSEDATRWLGSKAGYRPAGEGYPQIIQGQDYASVEAIRTLYVEASGTAKLGEFGFEDHREGKADASKIVITGARKTVDIELGSRIRIGQRFFADKGTIFLFQTLGRLLTELGSQCRPQGVRGRRLGTRAYRDNIRIEFSYGPVVVSLESASNGPANPERLYVLDMIESKSSLLWAEERPVSAH